MITVELRTPLSRGDVANLEVGTRVSISGTIYSMRDQACLRLLQMIREGKELPVDLTNSVIFHAGPAVRKEDGEMRILSIGPTTSARMNSITPDLIRLLDLRMVIGKGGMDEGVLSQMGRTGCVYASAIGGCATLYTRSIRKLKRVIWEEMGPEAIYELQVERFSPLVVTMDAKGESIHAHVEHEIRENLERIMEI